MIQLVSSPAGGTRVEFYRQTDGGGALFTGELLQTFWQCDAEGSTRLKVGLGSLPLDPLGLRQACATATRECRSHNLTTLCVEIGAILEENGLDALQDVAEGLLLGGYQPPKYPITPEPEMQISLLGVAEADRPRAQTILREMETLAQSVFFARDMVNLPGNLLRPADFAARLADFAKSAGAEVEILDRAALATLGMEALLAVGDSSAFPPCMVVLRYRGAPESSNITALVGKGVTCDTGGYCLKPARSMLGIKGDMAGGAAVAGALAALAKNKAKTNAVAVIPICENRIAPGSLLPGDVIGSYGGKTIEIGNTDAEGRLILADAVTYALRNEKATEVVDIATLTGAVVNLLGFSIGGVIADDEPLYQRFEAAFHQSKERYLRIPFYAEHEKMIESKIADIRNVGESYCGTIAAGLFIRAFAQGRPWLHLDIAGTAWVDTPVFAFQTAGATGAGVTTLYRLCQQPH